MRTQNIVEYWYNSRAACASTSALAAGTLGGAKQRQNRAKEKGTLGNRTLDLLDPNEESYH